MYIFFYITDYVMTVFNKHDWTSLAQHFQTMEPFPSICIDNFLIPEFAQQVADSYNNYDELTAYGDVFRAINEKKKLQITNPEHFPDPVAKLADALASEEHINNMKLLSGVDDLSWDPNFSGGGMHLTDTSGALDVHVDFNYSNEIQLYRRLNVLIYFNPEWRDNWGGNVELWDSSVSRCEHSFAPILNRCIIFSTSDYSFHGVTSVTSPKGISRNSFAVYYYAKASAHNIGDLYGENHSTIFKARPDEKLKKYWLMPMESFRNSIASKKRAVKKLIKNHLK
jgi:hypothetical protein